MTRLPPQRNNWPIPDLTPAERVHQGLTLMMTPMIALMNEGST